MEEATSVKTNILAAILVVILGVGVIGGSADKSVLIPPKVSIAHAGPTPPPSMPQPDQQPDDGNDPGGPLPLCPPACVSIAK
jgi:hypothetical protein